jgi:hypothetical protein
MIYLVLLILEILILYFLSRRVVKAVYRLFYKVTKRKNWTMYLFAVLFWPGTFIHEMSHFMAALFLLVPVGKLVLLPDIEEKGGTKLGSVAIAKTDPIRRFIIGIAPLVFGIAIIFTLVYFVSMNQFIDTWWGYLLAGFVIFQIANSMFASKKDLEGAIVLFVLLLVILLILILLGVDVSAFFTNLKFNTKLLKIFQKANLFLLVPIIIDTVFLLLLKRLRF